MTLSSVDACEKRCSNLMGSLQVPRAEWTSGKEVAGFTGPLDVYLKKYQGGWRDICCCSVVLLCNICNLPNGGREVLRDSHSLSFLEVIYRVGLVV